MFLKAYELWIKKPLISVLSEKRKMGQLHVATYHHMSKKIGEQQHFEEGDTSLWQVKDKDDKYNFRSNSKTCVENIRITIQESKFIHISMNIREREDNLGLIINP